MSTAAPLQANAARPPRRSTAPDRGLLLQRKCACGSPTGSMSGECAQCQGHKLQRSGLAIGAPEDRFEQQADQVANAVASGRRKAASPMQNPLFVRPDYTPPKPDSCEVRCVKSSADEDECEDCCVRDCCPAYPADKQDKCKSDCMGTCNNLKDETATVPVPSASARPAGPQAKAMETMNASADNHAAPQAVDEIVRSPGQPLNQATRAFMESHLGYDFSQVRVHLGTAAERSAREVNAHAYTVGRNIVFGAGRFAPETHAGRQLLAHELTHVVQQSGPDAIRLDRRHETPGRPRTPGGCAPIALQRKPAAPPASTGAALYPTTGERGHIQEILNPLAGQAGEPPPVTDPDGFKAAMRARMKPYIDGAVASARKRQSSPVSLSLATIKDVGDIAQPTVERFYGAYLGAAVHTPDETARRKDFQVREHLHLVPNTLQPDTDAIGKDWVRSRMEQQGGDLLLQFNVRTGAGARDQALFASVADTILADRKDDVRTIILFQPGFHGEGEASVQPKVEPLDEKEPAIETERRGRWQTLGTTIHEMLHAVTHERFVEVVKPLERSRMAVEGFTEYFTRPVYDNLAERAAQDDTLRASIEGVAAPYNSSLVPEKDPGGYLGYVDAVHKIITILGGSDEGLKRAYFQGLVEYIGLGGWNEGEAARQRLPGNTLGFGALLTFDSAGLFRVDYSRIVMGRAGALQLHLGGQVNYLTQGQRLGVAGTVSLRYQGTDAYIEGRLGVGGSASAGGAPLTDSVRLDLIPGMEAGVRIGAFRVGANAMLLTPIKGGAVSDRVLRLGAGIGIGLDF